MIVQLNACHFVIPLSLIISAFRIMKTMKLSILFSFAVISLALVSCVSNKENKVEQSDAATGATFVSTPYTGSIAGEWSIDRIELYDTLTINSADVESDEPLAAMFTDSTYHFRTNCNLVQGDYTKAGDTISFAPGFSTRMACPDMTVETALIQLLPQLTTVSMDNDSTLRFSSANPSAYILLRR